MTLKVTSRFNMTTGKNDYKAYQREKIMDVLDEATGYMSAEDIAEAAGLGSQCVQKHLKYLGEIKMCHHIWKPASGRGGRLYLYARGRKLADANTRTLAAQVLHYIKQGMANEKTPAL